MTIKEIEDLSGMTRANIRFYESQGLLTQGIQTGTGIIQKRTLKR